jgi:hypothetical protein
MLISIDTLQKRPQIPDTYIMIVQGGSLNRGKNGAEPPPPPVLGCEGRNYYYLIGWDPSAG